MSLWGNRDRVADKPKFANTNNSSLYGNTYGVTDTETVNASTKVKGIHSGWVSVKAYKDVHGNARFKAETLVAGSDINKKPVGGDTASISKTGTVSVSNGGTTVTGVGTSFTTQLSIGSVIRIDTSSYVFGTVLAIANNTSLTLASGASAAKSGKAFVEMVANTTPYTDDTDSNSFFQGN